MTAKPWVSFDGGSGDNVFIELPREPERRQPETGVDFPIAFTLPAGDVPSFVVIPTVVAQDSTQ